MHESLTKHEADVSSSFREFACFFQDADPFVRTSLADERLGQCQATIQLIRVSAERLSRKARRIFLAALGECDIGLECESVGLHVLNTLCFRG